VELWPVLFKPSDKDLHIVPVIRLEPRVASPFADAGQMVSCAAAFSNTGADGLHDSITPPPEPVWSATLLQTPFKIIERADPGLLDCRSAGWVA